MSFLISSRQPSSSQFTTPNHHQSIIPSSNPGTNKSIKFSFAVIYIGFLPGNKISDLKHGIMDISADHSGDSSKKSNLINPLKQF